VFYLTAEILKGSDVFFKLMTDVTWKEMKVK